MTYSPWQFPHYSFFGVSGDTLVMTRDQGNVLISTLFATESKAVESWNGTGWEQTTVGSAGLAQPLYLVTLSNGATLTVSAGYNWYAKVTDRLSFHGVKSSLIAQGVEVWRTETESDPYGSDGFPTVVSVAPTGNTGDVFYVASSSGLTLYNDVLASCGYAPEGPSGSAPPVEPPSVPDPVAPDRSFSAPPPPRV